MLTINYFCNQATVLDVYAQLKLFSEVIPEAASPN